MKNKKVLIVIMTVMFFSVKYFVFSLIKKKV